MTQPDRPLFVSRVRAAYLAGVSLRTLERMIKTGDVPSCVMRRRRLIPFCFLEKLAKDIEG